MIRQISFFRSWCTTCLYQACPLPPPSQIPMSSTPPTPAIVHSKKLIPDVYLIFSNVLKHNPVSLFHCLKDAFVLLTFQFEVGFTFGKQLYFFCAKISGFAFLSTSNCSLQVCVVHVCTNPTCGAKASHG